MKKTASTMIAAMGVSLLLSSCIVYTTNNKKSKPEAADPAKPDKPKPNPQNKDEVGVAPNNSENGSGHSTTHSTTPEMDSTPVAAGTLGAKVSGYSRINTRFIDFSKGAKKKKVMTGVITDPKKMKNALQAANPAQKLSRSAAKCLFSHVMEFVGETGEIKGRVGLCVADKPTDKHAAVFVDVDKNGKVVSRRGMVIPRGKDFAQAVKASVNRSSQTAI